MSLAGAGRSPHNYCRQAISAVRRTPPHKAKRQFCAFYCCQAIPADRRKPNPTKQNISFALFIADRHPAVRRPPKKAAVLAPAAPSTHPCPVRSSPQSRAGTTSLLPTRLQPGAPTGKNEKRGRIKRPQRKGVTDNKKSFRGNRERIRKHREKTQPTGSTEKSRAEPSRNQSGT